MLTIREYIKSELKTIYSQGEISAITQLILDKRLNISIIDSLTYKFNNLSDEQLSILSQIIEKIKQKEPIQYVLSESEFYNLPFSVNNNVLIPRPETEELVEWIIESEKNQNISLLDIGTGSGCIAISLSHNMPSANISAWDVSPQALEVAQQNAKLNNTKVSFALNDILMTQKSETLFDVIVSNPPYITEKEKEQMHNTVTDFEPHIALFVPNHNPLLFYKHIATFALKSLKDNGRLYFEIHRSYGQETMHMLAEKGFVNIELRKDMAGNDRMIRATKK